MKQILIKLVAALLLLGSVVLVACQGKGGGSSSTEQGTTGGSTSIADTTEPTGTTDGTEPPVTSGEEVREPMEVDNFGLIDYAAGEGLLYNGIERPTEWPPKTVDPMVYNNYKIPYLLSSDKGGYRPEVIDITVGRQLFVDNFLIADTDLKTEYHHPEKYRKNPILRPGTIEEISSGWMNVGLNAGGVWYDMTDGKYKMWYAVAFTNALGYAESEDGLHWERIPVTSDGSNIVLDGDDGYSNSASVFIDYEAPAEERYKMFVSSLHNHTDNLDYDDWYTINGTTDENNYAHALYVSADGIHWTQLGELSKGVSGDMTTAFYNVFTGEWVNSLRSYARTNYYGNVRNGRVRYYAAGDNFIDLLNWTNDDVVFWMKPDGKDAKDKKYDYDPQLYNFNAIGYESLMVGMFQIWRGPENNIVESSGEPKITELIAAYSRDGFYYDRPDRTAFIEAEREDGEWDKGYLFGGIGGSMIVKEDEIWFYYSGMSGYLMGNTNKNGHAGSSIGLAILRRDGFASLNGKGEMITRQLTTNGDKKYLFVNIDAPLDSFRAELIDAEGNVIEGYSMEDCIAVGGDNTCKMITWKNGKDVSFLNGTEFQIRFSSSSEETKFYAFWLSDGTDGNSGGAVGSGYAGAN